MSNSLSILPLTPEQLQVATAAAVAHLTQDGLSVDEAAIKLEFDFDAWLDDDASRSCPAIVETLLGVAGWDAPTGKTRGKCYAALLSKLSSRSLMRRRDAAMVLAHLPLMLLLARNFRASPARIAELLRRTDGGRASVSWRSVNVILREFAIRCDLKTEEVTALLLKDRQDSAAELGDATISSMVESLSAQASALGLGKAFQDALRLLFSEDDKVRFVPYLQMLLHISVVDHFFDHPPEYIYTFSPRGNVAQIIFGAFPSALAPSGSPVLNNFKAVDRLSHDWAESREAQAKALAVVVAGLTSLAYAPRNQMTSSIRRAVIRYIEIQTPAEIKLETQSDLEVIKRFLHRVSEAETETRGVIEQRVGDFFGMLDHPQPEWRSRGLGDPVNASNSSSGKLGDCDFQNVAAQECVAIEAHGGRLTDVYVREHLRTLRLNLPARLEEWTRISDVDEWKLRILFFAHEDARSGTQRQPPERVKSLNVIRYRDHYESLLPKIDRERERIIELFNRWIIVPLDAPNTPQVTKQKALSLLQP
jgi:hypothetical protein